MEKNPEGLYKRQCLFLQQIVVRIAANLILTTNDITESIQ